MVEFSELAKSRTHTHNIGSMCSKLAAYEAARERSRLCIVRAGGGNQSLSTR